MGFLSSLRRNFEDAMEERKQEEVSTPQSGMDAGMALARKASPQSSMALAGLNSQDATYAVTESSSGNTSHEESESGSSDSIMLASTGKKVDISSSEESDREQASGDRGYGPPRKRHKNRGGVGEFTSKNVAYHNCRMNALHGSVMRHKLSPETNAYDMSGMNENSNTKKRSRGGGQ